MTRKSVSKSRPYHHGELREALIRAALEILESDGLDAVSLRGVARRAGVSQAAPYSHFQNKEALLAAVGEVGYARLADRMSRCIDGLADPAARIVALGCCYVRFALDMPGLFRLMFGREICERFRHDERLQGQAGRSYELITAAVAERISDPSGTGDGTRFATAGAWALVHGLSVLLLDGKLTAEKLAVEDDEALARRITTLFADCLGAFS